MSKQPKEPKPPRQPARQAVTVHYRRLADATGAFGKLTLEAAVRKAMNSQSDGGKISAHWKRRAWLIPPGSDETLLMNLHSDGATYYFGDLTLYTKGYMQALLAEVPDVPSLSVEQQAPPKGKEYIHSMMYWMVIKNHVLMIQSRSLTAKQLEEFLTWLLKDRSAAISPTGQVILQAKFDADDVGGDLNDIKEIIVGGQATNVGSAAVTETETAAAPAEKTKYSELGTRKPWPTRAIEVLRAVMNNEADVQKLLESVPQGANLDIAVHIGYKAKREVSRAPMQEALRNLPEGEITAIGRNGRMTGNDIRLSHPANVLKSGNLLDPTDVVRALREAYQFFVDNGKIDIPS
jgi:hypothetical protein